MTANSETPLHGRGCDRSGTKSEDDAVQRKRKHAKSDENRTTKSQKAWIPKKNDEELSPKHSTLREDAPRRTECCNDGEGGNALSRGE